MTLEWLGLVGLLAAGAVLGSLVMAVLLSGQREHDPPEPLTPLTEAFGGAGPDLLGAPLKPGHVHVWQLRSTEQTNGQHRTIYGCRECPALEIRVQELAGG
jgi:hypothetical protein